jgi:uncharacterized protein YkwD
MSGGRATATLRPRLCVEQLEARQLLAGYAPTAVEQLFLEQLNDARANPAAYGASIGIDLSSVAPSQPLAFNPDLIESARLHSQDMNARAYFAHDTPEGIDPGARITAAGFMWNSWGESIAGGTAFPQTSDALSGLIIDSGVPDLGHRRQLLAIDTMYKGQNQVGIGIVQNGTGPLVNYYTIDTASSPGGGPFLTGVVFNDVQGSGKYAIGEGLGGVTISLNGTPAVVTWDTGGYSIAVAPGTYTVTASGGALPAPITQVVSVGSDNARVNFNPTSDAYITKFYTTILNRQPSSAEVAGWLPVLAAQGPAAVASAFEHSAEARTRLVDGWYATYLGRQAQNGEEQPLVAALVNGQTEEQALALVLGSPEFYSHAGALSGTGTADQRYVATLYSLLLNRSAAAGELNYWVAALGPAGRNAVALGIARSTEYRDDEVRAYYSSMLHRPASGAEISLWAGSGMDLTTIRVCFEASTEFYLHG